MNDRGQIFIPWLVLVLVFIGVMTVVGAKASEVFFQRSQAQTAADAAALAGVLKGESAADAAARKNNATLRSFQQIENDVLVEAQVGKQTAKARASSDFGSTSASNSAATTGSTSTSTSGSASGSAFGSASTSTSGSTLPK